MKIKVKEITPGCKFEYINKGEWIDLRNAEDVCFTAPQAESRKKIVVDGKQIYYRNVYFDTCVIPLGIAMELPKGFEAVILPRSSTFNNYAVILSNSEGVIDSSYCGDNDEWKFQAIALESTNIPKGSRICQFKIQLSQKATFWQKLKWLFSNKIEFVWVDTLGNKNRGGFGTTGKL